MKIKFMKLKCMHIVNVVRGHFYKKISARKQIYGIVCVNALWSHTLLTYNPHT